MHAKLFLVAAAMIAAAPAAAHDAGRLGWSAFADPHERVYDRFDGRARDGSRALAAYYGFGTYISPFDREFRWPERIERDRDGSLSYDRDYPYEFRTRSRAASGAVVVASSDLRAETFGDAIAVEGGVRVFRGGGARADDLEGPAR